MTTPRTMTAERLGFWRLPPITQGENELLIELDAERAAHQETQAKLDRESGVWRCFHCGFDSADQSEAQAHFGERDDAEEFTPICTWWARLSKEERAQEIQELQRQFTAEQDENGNLRQKIEGLEYRIDGQLCEIHSFKPFRSCDSIHQVFNVYDSMEGRALLAEQQLAEAQAISRELLAALEAIPLDALAIATDRVREQLDVAITKARGVLPENDTAGAPDTPAEANAK